MASDTSIVNLALRRLGDKPIASLTERDPRAEEVSDIYDIVRDAMLCEYNWTFASKESSLVQSATFTPTDYAYAYALPADLLKIQRLLGASGSDLSDEECGVRTDSTNNSFIVSDNTSMSIVYTYAITEPALFTPLFADTLAWRIAMEMATGRTDQNGLYDRMERGYLLSLRKAFGADAQQVHEPWTGSRAYIKAR